MSSGANVGSIYSQMILDTSQYEKALRDLVGLNNKKSKNLESDYQGVNKSLNGLEDKFKSTKKNADGFGDSLRALSGILGSAAIIGGLKSVTMEAAKMETVNTSFRVMLGSAEKAKSVLKDLTQYSLETPFTPTQVFQAGKALTAFGITSKELIPTLQKVGDVAAGTGKDFNALSVIYGKAFIAGNIYAEDLNQLMEAGVPIIKELSKVLNVQEDSVKKLASQGKIGFGDMDKAFSNMTSSGGRYFGMMEEQSKTLEGSISTMDGNLTGVSVLIGEQLLPIAKALVQAVSGIAKSIGEFAAENPVLFKTIIRLTGALALMVSLLIGGAGLKAAITLLIPLLNALGITAVSAGGKIAFAFGPAGAAFLAIGLVIGMIANAQDRLNKLNAQRVDKTTESILKLSGAERKNAIEGLKLLSVTDLSLKKSGAGYKNLEKAVKAFGLTLEQVGRTSNPGAHITRQSFAVDSASIRDVLANIQKAVDEKPISTTITAPGSSGNPKKEYGGDDGSYNERLLEIQKNLDKAIEKRDKFTVYGSDAWSEANRDVAGYTTELNELEGNINTGMFDPLIKSVEKLGFKIGNTAKLGLSMFSSLAEGYMGYLSTMAQAASQQFANVQQKIAGVSDWGQAILDKQIQATMEAYDLESRSLQEQKDKLIQIEEDYQNRRDEIRNEEIDKIKAKIEAEYQMQAEKAMLEYENDLLKQETDMASDEQRKVNQERLEEEHLQNLSDLKSRYDDMTEEEIRALTQTMSDEDSVRAENHKVELDAIALKEKQIEAQKIAEKEASDKKKADLEKKLKLYEWAMGRQSFEASKKLQMATIQMQMAQGVISAVTAGAMMAATIPIIGWILGPALAVALSGMVISAGMSSLAAVGSSQYQPPPAAAFAEGGLVTGGIPGIDSVSARLMPGELVVPTKNFDEVVGAVKTDRQGGAISIYGNNFYGIDSPDSFVQQISEKILENTRGAVSAFI